MNKVSVIIPLYNAMPFFKETIDSVLRQTQDNLELIVIDDGSTDGALEHLEALNLPNLIITSNKGKGACAARNYGFQLSSGDYIQYLDADDLLSETKIETQVNLLKNNPKSIAVCSTKHFYNTIDNGKITDRPFLESTNNPKELLLNLFGADGKTQNMVQTSAWLTPRTLIEEAGPWDERLKKDQDGEFFCRVVTKAENVLYSPTVLNYYRKHVGGSNIASQKKRIHLESQLKALNSKAKQFSGLEKTQAYNNAMALQYKVLAINAYPKFKDFAKVCLNRSSEYGGSKYLPVLGGRIIEIIKTILGWKIAKSFSYWVHKIDFR
ncbi:glycosyltransferase family 2 protein [Winogradskyella sp. PG-2]|uniref:glycosyltransferase family 2 protein n=1 Tax=Winogradskyella sp. PG-2 TaxID=754409 RepID=UPI0004586613|nr:glycosyltransferase family 2 protein [Winogradskyella sp. PG-2]BAO76192.1 probable glycosyl transferase [Winogradskyella sp. PG-2]